LVNKPSLTPQTRPKVLILGAKRGGRDTLRLEGYGLRRESRVVSNLYAVVSQVGKDKIRGA